MACWKKNSAFILPSLFTVLNLVSGIIAIILAINERFALSAWTIIAAVLFDGLDGKIARWTDCESEFGLQLDSLADLVSSGIAPVVLMYQWIFHPMPWPYAWICLVYVFSGTYRLARFNAIQKGDRSKGYVGLPIPVAGMVIAAFYLFSGAVSMRADWLFVTALLLVNSVLMISTIPYEWPKLEWRAGRLKIAWSLFLLVCVAAMIIITKWSLFPILCLYIILGICHYVLTFVREAWTLNFLK